MTLPPSGLEENCPVHDPTDKGLGKLRDGTGVKYSCLKSGPLNLKNTSLVKTNYKIERRNDSFNCLFFYWPMVYKQNKTKYNAITELIQLQFLDQAKYYNRENQSSRWWWYLIEFNRIQSSLQFKLLDVSVRTKEIITHLFILFYFIFKSIFVYLFVFILLGHQFKKQIIKKTITL